jgi:hypothetical protein
VVIGGFANEREDLPSTGGCFSHGNDQMSVVAQWVIALFFVSFQVIFLAKSVETRRKRGV